MKVLIFGASGMVGLGVLRECLVAADVTQVTTIGRTPADTSLFRRDRMDAGFNYAVSHKLRQVTHADMFDYAAIEPLLAGYDACFFCLGVSSLGMREDDYARITYDLTLAAARTLRRLNPGMRFVYVSGASTDSSEQGKTMWARVKGRTENALLGLGFGGAFMFRPGAMIAMHGVRSKTLAYRILYPVLGPLLPLARLIWPDQVLTTELIGRAMLEAARRGAAKGVLESPDIRRLAAGGA
ncbi:NAD-dependent epimerase/dehydratase family protein [Herbaspirillum robiniae]|uniref:Epimerase n=1 Tax=Herbaspirillum robiniae TaxID=2014887 RepID=A0A246WUM7_9BURK|nr:NAD-dependent epimerase/dehydratase family protein [Herbaspirillum robiniae]OWY30769.1 epimerase [Herbaspirillum robiniae]